MISNEFKDYFKKLVKTEKSVDGICKKLQISEDELNLILNELRNVGNNYVIHNNSIEIKNRPDIKNKTLKINSDKDYIRLLLLGDIHLVSKKCKRDLLFDLYEIAEKTNTDYALVCGDVVDGYTLKYSNFKNQIFIDTYEGQKNYVIENYPHASFKTLMVSGNHDDWWFRFNNSEILKDISKKREDMIYLGANSANIKIGDLKINLLHGDIIPSTNEWFNTNKYISMMDEKPHIMHYGHTHFYDYSLRNKIYCFRTPSLMNSSSYSHSSEKGGYFVDIHMDDNGKVKEIIKKRKEYK